MSHASCTCAATEMPYAVFWSVSSSRVRQERVAAPISSTNVVFGKRKKLAKMLHRFSTVSVESAGNDRRRWASSWQAVNRICSVVVFRCLLSITINGCLLSAHVLSPNTLSGSSVSSILIPLRSSSLSTELMGPSPQRHCSRRMSAAFCTSPMVDALRF